MAEPVPSMIPSCTDDLVCTLIMPAKVAAILQTTFSKKGFHERNASYSESNVTEVFVPKGPIANKPTLVQVMV